jgi:hypothetical protein
MSNPTIRRAQALLEAGFYLRKAIGAIRPYSKDGSAIGTIIKGIFVMLNAIIVELLRQHFTDVNVQLEETSKWSDLHSKLEVSADGLILSIPVAKLEELDPQLAKRVRIKIMPHVIKFNNVDYTLPVEQGTPVQFEVVNFSPIGISYSRSDGDDEMTYKQTVQKIGESLYFVKIEQSFMYTEVPEGELLGEDSTSCYVYEVNAHYAEPKLSNCDVQSSFRISVDGMIFTVPVGKNSALWVDDEVSKLPEGYLVETDYAKRGQEVFPIGSNLYLVHNYGEQHDHLDGGGEIHEFEEWHEFSVIHVVENN